MPLKKKPFYKIRKFVTLFDIVDTSVCAFYVNTRQKRSVCCARPSVYRTKKGTENAPNSSPQQTIVACEILGRPRFVEIEPTNRENINKISALRSQSMHCGWKSKSFRLIDTIRFYPTKKNFTNLSSSICTVEHCEEKKVKTN